MEWDPWAKQELKPFDPMAAREAMERRERERVQRDWDKPWEVARRKEKELEAKNEERKKTAVAAIMSAIEERNTWDEGEDNDETFQEDDDQSSSEEMSEESVWRAADERGWERRKKLGELEGKLKFQQNVAKLTEKLFYEMGWDYTVAPERLLSMMTPELITQLTILILDENGVHNKQLQDEILEKALDIESWIEYETLNTYIEGLIREIKN